MRSHFPYITKAIAIEKTSAEICTPICDRLWQNQQLADTYEKLVSWRSQMIRTHTQTIALRES